MIIFLDDVSRQDSRLRSWVKGQAHQVKTIFVLISYVNLSDTREMKCVNTSILSRPNHSGNLILYRGDMMLSDMAANCDLGDRV